MKKYLVRYDYSVGAHPKVLEAVCAVNLEGNHGYGDDGYTARAKERIREVCGCPDAMVEFLIGGTQTTDKPLVASLAIECGALVSIMAADTRIVNGQTLGTMLLALPDDDKAAAALDYIKNYPGITYEEVNG